jgi:hypothetical protein
MPAAFADPRPSVRRRGQRRDGTHFRGAKGDFAASDGICLHPFAEDIGPEKESLRGAKGDFGTETESLRGAKGDYCPVAELRRVEAGRSVVGDGWWVTAGGWPDRIPTQNGRIVFSFGNSITVCADHSCRQGIRCRMPDFCPPSNRRVPTDDPGLITVALCAEAWLRFRHSYAQM